MPYFDCGTHGGRKQSHRRLTEKRREQRSGQDACRQFRVQDDAECSLDRLKSQLLRSILIVRKSLEEIVLNVITGATRVVPICEEPQAAKSIVGLRVTTELCDLLPWRS